MFTRFHLAVRVERVDSQCEISQPFGSSFKNSSNIKEKKGKDGVSGEFVVLNLILRNRVRTTQFCMNFVVTICEEIYFEYGKNGGSLVVRI